MVDETDEPDLHIGSEFTLRDVTVTMFATRTSEITTIIVPELVCREGRNESFEPSNYTTFEYQFDFYTPGELPDAMSASEHFVTMRGTHPTGRVIQIKGLGYPWFDVEAKIIDGIFDLPPSMAPFPNPPEEAEIAAAEAQARPALKLVRE